MEKKTENFSNSNRFNCLDEINIDYATQSTSTTDSQISKEEEKEESDEFLSSKTIPFSSYPTHKLVREYEEEKNQITKLQNQKEIEHIFHKFQEIKSGKCSLEKQFPLVNRLRDVLAKLEKTSEDWYNIGTILSMFDMNILAEKSFEKCLTLPDLEECHQLSLIELIFIEINGENVKENDEKKIFDLLFTLFTIHYMSLIHPTQINQELFEAYKSSSNYLFFFSKNEIIEEFTKHFQSLQIQSTERRKLFFINTIRAILSYLKDNYEESITSFRSAIDHVSPHSMTEEVRAKNRLATMHTIAKEENESLKIWESILKKTTEYVLVMSNLAIIDNKKSLTYSLHLSQLMKEINKLNFSSLY
ncbi:hypothetical protein SNEBB_004838 [Seison nebaliae]|nr:hypothetical protein SNEBB_004838 [Seison nebaliae]